MSRQIDMNAVIAVAVQAAQSYIAQQQAAPAAQPVPAPTPVAQAAPAPVPVAQPAPAPTSLPPHMHGNVYPLTHAQVAQMSADQINEAWDQMIKPQIA